MLVAGACFRLNHNWGVFRRALHLGLRPLVAEARKCAQATSGHAHEGLAAEPEFGQTTVATPVVCLRSDGSHCKPLACPAGGFAFLTPRSACLTVEAAPASRYGREAVQRTYTDLHTFAHRAGVTRSLQSWRRAPTLTVPCRARSAPAGCPPSRCQRVGGRASG